MIVRCFLLLQILLLTASCGSSQGPNFTLSGNNYTYNKISTGEKEQYAEAIKTKYQTILGNKNFSGQILVAKNGEIIFEDYKILIKSFVKSDELLKYHQYQKTIRIIFLG